MRRSINSLLVFLVLMVSNCWSQGDSIPYTTFSEKVVLYGDIGYTSAPFSIRYPFKNGINKLQFKNNFRTVIGLGGSYKWFSLRLGLPIPVDVRPKSRYGETRPINIGGDFTIKKTYFDVDLRFYHGYAIKNAKKWNDTLNDLHPNDIRPNTDSYSFSINAWYFRNKHMRMSAMRGKTSHYNRSLGTWYVKFTFNSFGVENTSGTVLPSALIDTANSKTASSFFRALDLGAVPGYGYVYKNRNWQVSVLTGLGGVIQNRGYEAGGTNRQILGLAPRYDFRLIAGYTVPSYFIFFVSDFDNKSYRYNDLKIRQTFYNVKLVAGVRLETKKARQEKERKRNAQAPVKI